MFSGSLMSAIRMFLVTVFSTLLSAAIRIDHLVGIGDRAVCGSSPFLILSTTSMPLDDLADDGVLAVEERAVGEHDEELRIGGIRVLRARHADRAALEVRSCENSAGRSGSSEPPVPVPVGSPVCAMKPSMTRWKATPL